MRPAPAFWRNKRVLLTGHTGFKGGWLALWLARLGAHVTGAALPPDTTPSLFEAANIAAHLESHFCDIRDAERLKNLVHTTRPEIVFHLAAQPLVRSSYQCPTETFATNMMGSVHLLDALRGLDCVRVAVMVTTDKVYQNRETRYAYQESDSLGGHDPYSASKAASEIVIASYRDAFLAKQGIALASARAGNVIGGGDWSADRLIPDAVRAWENGRPLQIRRPDAVRPWQHVLDPLAGYLRLAEMLWEKPSLAGPYNFGPDATDAASVRQVVEATRAIYGAGDVVYETGDAGPHEAGLLMLDNSKARTILDVSPRWALNDSIARTIHWYRGLTQSHNALALCSADIDAYET